MLDNFTISTTSQSTKKEKSEEDSFKLVVFLGEEELEFPEMELQELIGQNLAQLWDSADKGLGLCYEDVDGENIAIWGEEDFRSAIEEMKAYGYDSLTLMTVEIEHNQSLLKSFSQYMSCLEDQTSLEANGLNDTNFNQQIRLVIQESTKKFEEEEELHLQKTKNQKEEGDVRKRSVSKCIVGETPIVELTLRKSESFDPSSTELAAFAEGQEQESNSIEDLESLERQLGKEEENKLKSQLALGLEMDQGICRMLDMGKMPCLECQADQRRKSCRACESKGEVFLSEEGRFLKAYIDHMAKEYERRINMSWKKNSQGMVSGQQEESLMGFPPLRSTRKSSMAMKLSNEGNSSGVNTNTFVDEYNEKEQEFEELEVSINKNLKQSKRSKGRYRNSRPGVRRGARTEHKSTSRTMAQKQQNLFGRYQISAAIRKQSEDITHFDYKKHYSPELSDHGVEPIKESSRLAGYEPKLLPTRSIDKDQVALLTQKLNELPEVPSIGSDSQFENMTFSGIPGSSGKYECESCGLEDKGVVYSCQECDNYFLCEKCFKSKDFEHDEDHTFSAEVTDLALSGDPSESTAGRNLPPQASRDGRTQLEYEIEVLTAQVLIKKTKRFSIEMRLSNKSGQKFPASTKIKGFMEANSGYSASLESLRAGRVQDLNFKGKYKEVFNDDKMKQFHLKFGISSEDPHFYWKNFFLKFDRDSSNKKLFHVSGLIQQSNDRSFMLAGEKKSFEEKIGNLCPNLGGFFNWFGKPSAKHSKGLAGA